MNFLTKTSYFSFLTIILCIITPLLGSLITIKKAAKNYHPIENVIFDLNGVLLKTNKIAYFSIIKSSIIKSIFSFNNPFKIKEKLFSILNKIKPKTPNSPDAKTPEGNIMPQIMIDWQSGIKNCKEVKKETVTFINKNPHLFKNKAEQNCILSLVNAIFSPYLLAKAQQPVKEAITFLKKLKKEGYTIYILSNFDAESFEKVYDKYPQIFNLIDKKNIIVSGNVKTIKPDHKIYQHLLHKYNLEPQSCIFIDDRIENIKAAQECNINAIQCHQKKKLFGLEPNIKKVEQCFYHMCLNKKYDTIAQ